MSYLGVSCWKLWLPCGGCWRTFWNFLDGFWILGLRLVLLLGRCRLWWEERRCGLCGAGLVPLRAFSTTVKFSTGSEVTELGFGGIDLDSPLVTVGYVVGYELGGFRTRCLFGWNRTRIRYIQQTGRPREMYVVLWRRAARKVWVLAPERVARVDLAKLYRFKASISRPILLSGPFNLL